MSSPTQSGLDQVLGTPTSGVWDLLVVGLIILAAVIYLYIKIWRRKGACTSCPTSGPGCSSCATGSFEFDTKTPLPKRSGDQ